MVTMYQQRPCRAYIFCKNMFCVKFHINRPPTQAKKKFRKISVFHRNSQPVSYGVCRVYWTSADNTFRLHAYSLCYRLVVAIHLSMANRRVQIIFYTWIIRSDIVPIFFSLTNRTAVWQTKQTYKTATLVVTVPSETAQRSQPAKRSHCKRKKKKYCIKSRTTTTNTKTGR